MAGKKPHRVAEIEAFQEAGVEGVINKKSLGAYPYPKIMPDGVEHLCLVEVYPLGVTFEAITRRESSERDREWLQADDAAELVDEGRLALLINAWK